MSSGLSPSRSNLKVTILSLCVCSWHSTTRSTLSESCTDGHDQWLTTGVCLLSKPPSKVKHRRNNVVLCVSKHVCESTVKYSVCCAVRALLHCTVCGYAWAVCLCLQSKHCRLKAAECPDQRKNVLRWPGEEKHYYRWCCTIRVELHRSLVIKKLSSLRFNQSSCVIYLFMPCLNVF